MFKNIHKHEKQQYASKLGYDNGYEHKVLLARMEAGWNYLLPTSSILSHSYRFDIKLCLISSLCKAP